ncbi:K02A2.6-like [Cordylochernes scorpioides]|uniref:RNA-directed DNA polymerase n=1 Tax=Cordylochernes scorpioides TaxID=51811 RepID=A0ABY6KB18_9ARAC|nr:K02A2.6-like [Cordylochernes scorpioides]
MSQNSLRRVTFAKVGKAKTNHLLDYYTPFPQPTFLSKELELTLLTHCHLRKNRKKWIIVLTDYYYKEEVRAQLYRKLTPGKGERIPTRGYFLKHGAPQYLISDRGSQFTSNLMKEVMKMCKIKHCFTRSYHPQTNGLTERLNGTLINMLSMYVNTDQKNWDEILPFITHAYNTTIQETTGYSPFFLMFEREPTSLLDDRNISVDIDKDDYDEYIKHHLDKIDRTRKLVINNTIKTQERMKKNYDKKHMERSYELGELVAVWTPIRKIRKCEKLLRKYFDPYRILKKMSSVNYLIEPKYNPGQDPLIVHVSRIKPYYERMDEVIHEDSLHSPKVESKDTQVNPRRTPRNKSCLRRARDSIYWHGMSQDIINTVENCRICQANQRNKTKEPMIIKEIPSLPWEIVAADIFSIKGKNNLLITVNYSGFIDFKEMKTMNSAETIESLKKWFSVHGIPRPLETDNGPNFTPRDFKDFQKKWLFDHQTSSPLYPKSNGLAERAVQTAKNLIRKCLDSGQEVEPALLNFYNTPRDGLPSSAQCLFSRRTRTLLPTSTHQLEPEIQKGDTQNLRNKREKQKTYHDKTAKATRSFKEGEKIMLKQHHHYIKCKHLLVSTAATAPSCDIRIWRIPEIPKSTLPERPGPSGDKKQAQVPE